jgi:hypothetical protein
MTLTDVRDPLHYTPLMPRECRNRRRNPHGGRQCSGIPDDGVDGMRLVQFSRGLTSTLFLVASSLSHATFPALGQASIHRGSPITDGAGVNPFGNIISVNLERRSPANSSECMRQPKVVGRTFDQNVVSIDRNIYPEDTFPGRSPQSAIMHWVSGYLRISGHYDLPCIEFAQTGSIAVLRSKNSHSKRRDMGAYDDTVNTIYLPEGWTGKTTAEVSILIHQMVYHVQNLAGLKYECSWERERLAYAAQESWLRLHDTNLWDAFAIDQTIFLLSAEYIC